MPVLQNRVFWRTGPVGLRPTVFSSFFGGEIDALAWFLAVIFGRPLGTFAPKMAQKCAIFGSFFGKNVQQ
eukprot:NODE_6274_length_641_cov_5.949324_g5342_i0.p2 GENE.NODE_6274_length_641_cov_5.949324_g5342_i0~~NODE_6274_length_641_cov_5.949324_g5342_i0.p2  ORF type:complete len:70 (-),score=0.34 NODE_6274_length_641_cov_5.949324_g5342_i0:89-298(-)